MQIVVNGDSKPLSADTRLPALIDQLRLAGQRVAVELNGAIVPRSRWAETALRDGDRVEIVHAIGGG